MRPRRQSSTLMEDAWAARLTRCEGPGGCGMRVQEGLMAVRPHLGYHGSPQNGAQGSSKENHSRREGSGSGYVSHALAQLSLKGRTAVGMWSDGDGEMSSRLLALQSRLAQASSFSVSRALRCSPAPCPPLNHQKQVP